MNDHAAAKTITVELFWPRRATLQVEVSPGATVAELFRALKLPPECYLTDARTNHELHPSDLLDAVPNGARLYASPPCFDP